MKKFVFIILLAFCTLSGSAQRVGVSTDLLKIAMLTPNISVETTLSSRLTLNIEGAVNPFGGGYDKFNLNNAVISPEVRWWFERTMYSHFVGVNLLATIYDLSYSDKRLKGQLLAAGVTYGYSFIISRRWSITPTIGLGCGLLEDGLTHEKSIKPVITKFGAGVTYIID